MRCWSQNPEERPTFDEIYKQLSTNFDFLKEDVEVDEIEDYLNDINDIDNIKMNLKNASEMVNSSNKYSEYLSSNLYLACKSENAELVKYILTLKAVDVNSKFVSFF